MINPSGDEFERDPLSASADVSGTEDFGARSASERASDAWEQTKDKASVARDRTEVFVRENPIPVLLGALGVGIAIGLAIRYASNSPDPEEQAREARAAMADKAWSFLSLPFLWPLLKTVRAKAEDSADAVKDGFERAKKVKVSKYTKPMRKRWKSWTS